DPASQVEVLSMLDTNARVTSTYTPATMLSSVADSEELTVNACDTFFSLRASVCGAILAGVAACIRDMEMASGSNYAKIQNDHASVVRIFDYSGNDALIARYSEQVQKLTEDEMDVVEECGDRGDASRYKEMGNIVNEYLETSRDEVRRWHSTAKDYSESGRTVFIDVSDMKQNSFPEEDTYSEQYTHRTDTELQSIDKTRYGADFEEVMSGIMCDNLQTMRAVYTGLISCVIYCMVEFLPVTESFVSVIRIAVGDYVDDSMFSSCKICHGGLHMTNDEHDSDVRILAYKNTTDETPAGLPECFARVMHDERQILILCKSCATALSAFRDVVRTERIYVDRCRDEIDGECCLAMSLDEQMREVFRRTVNEHVKGYVANMHVVLAAWGSYIGEGSKMWHRRFFRQCIGDRVIFHTDLQPKMHHSLQCYHYNLEVPGDVCVDDDTLYDNHDQAQHRPTSCLCVADIAEHEFYADDKSNTKIYFDGVHVSRIFAKCEHDLERLFSARTTTMQRLREDVDGRRDANGENGMEDIDVDIFEEIHRVIFYGLAACGTQCGSGMNGTLIDMQQKSIVNYSSKVKM
ncbi:hypothetical protein KDA14_04645, partial [Candidatus Saccharibacteria bacterium]|nr:hypothetical protein [Candidatus Saccharibacteria bacterium]